MTGKFEPKIINLYLAKLSNSRSKTRVLQTNIEYFIGQLCLPRLIQGILKCIFASGFVLFLNDGVNAQQNQSIEHWQAIVEQNPDDAQAWFNIGVLYEIGQGIQKNQTRAYESYQKAIAQGYAPAMYNLGSIYAKQKDYQNARLWWEKAAELDLPEAQYNMGMLYEKGWGVNVDPKLSSSWYQRAAETAMEKYFQLYQESRSQRQGNPVINEASLSILERLAFIKTASAAPTTQHVKTPTGSSGSVNLQLAQVDATSNNSSTQNSKHQEQLPGWNWVYSQPKENYTIQLFATKDPDKTDKFIQQYALSEQAQVIQAVVKGTTYFKVLTGNFTQWNDAAVEIGTFPQDLRNQRPWVRKFGSLYKELPEGSVAMSNDQPETQPTGNTDLNIDVNIEEADSISQSDQQTTDSQSQTAAPEELSSQTRAKVEQVPEVVEPVNEESDMPELIREDEPENQSVNDNQQSQAQQTQDESLVENTTDSAEMPLTDDVFTIYTKKQLTSNELSADIKTKLKSGLDAIQTGDYESGFNQLSILAESGLSEAQYRVALLYLKGKGVAQDNIKAFDLIKSASEQGHPYAQQSLADFYIKGIGVDVNSSLAAYWQQTAADNVKKLENQ